MEHNCCICDITINFSDINAKKDHVIMLNYNMILTGINMVDVICSVGCYQKYKEKEHHFCCINCNNICNDGKWFFDVKFINLGNWLSKKALCSEQCYIKFKNDAKKDEELHLRF